METIERSSTKWIKGDCIIKWWEDGPTRYRYWEDGVRLYKDHERMEDDEKRRFGLDQVALESQFIPDPDGDRDE